jgi:hypothetical protein
VKNSDELDIKLLFCCIGFELLFYHIGILFLLT